MKTPKILASALGALILVSTFAGAALAHDRHYDRHDRRDGWHNGYHRDRHWGWGRARRNDWNNRGPRNGYYARRGWGWDRNHRD